MIHDEVAASRLLLLISVLPRTLGEEYFKTLSFRLSAHIMTENEAILHLHKGTKIGEAALMYI
jgi:hypothetical protein